MSSLPNIHDNPYNNRAVQWHREVFGNLLYAETSIFFVVAYIRECINTAANEAATPQILAVQHKKSQN